MFRINPHQARQMNLQFIMLIQGAHFVLQRHPSVREYHLGVFVGILG